MNIYILSTRHIIKYIPKNRGYFKWAHTYKIQTREVLINNRKYIETVKLNYNEEADIIIVTIYWVSSNSQTSILRWSEKSSYSKSIQQQTISATELLEWGNHVLESPPERLNSLVEELKE